MLQFFEFQDSFGDARDQIVAEAEPNEVPQLEDGFQVRNLVEGEVELFCVDSFGECGAEPLDGVVRVGDPDNTVW
jgi:hypothetical protein